MEWIFYLKSSPEQLWPHVSNTNRLLKDIKQPTIQAADISRTKKPGHAELSYNSIKRYEAWIEEPCQWEYPYCYEIHRTYKTGPYHHLVLRIDMTPGKSTTLLKVNIIARPKVGLMPFLATLKLKTLIKNRLKKTLRFYDRLASTGNPSFIYNRNKKLTRGSGRRLEEIRNQLRDYPVDITLFDRMLGFIQQADDIELAQIDPEALAGAWNKPVDDVINFMICASKAGLLNFNWKLHCDKCRKIQAVLSSLNKMHQHGYCEHCREEFVVNFNRSIRLNFRPHPLVRKINDSQYCVQGPHTRKHVLIQQYLKPGQKQYLKTRLPEGTYILRTSDSEGTAVVEVCNDGIDTVYIGLNENGFEGEEVHIRTDPNLIMENRTGTPLIATLEKAEWDQNALTAARITSFQSFRDHFGDDLLRKGEKIAVDNLTLMFTDLFDSTGMYNKEGDDKAVGRVIDHFEILQKAVSKECGAIVKTIGDSVMAVFHKPEQALRAYLNAHQHIFTNKTLEDSLRLKAGIHHGSCVAVNLNSRIDYFGSTVNIASRLVDFAGQNELMISEQALTKINLKGVLQQFDSDYLTESITTGLKGFENETFSIKNIKLDRSGLRLAI